MTQEEINKYSVLMAEFEGYRLMTDEEVINIKGIKNKKTLDDIRKYETWQKDIPYMINDNTKEMLYLAYMNYHYDWNKLMPVWVKFRDLEFDRHTEKVKFLSHQVKCQDLRYHITDNLIKEAFEELSKAIEWYNTIKK